ncbi:hypothetical protein SAMN04487897_102340 [Paenibacillus sp. yr247]|uniref:hypothetical protein n=1 Tax=Paenibacillus sp. yr247 TaxID=1761880 RepID=UPI00088D415D|nr:hypothetical protein [Paenibacillus sp. yr247]SDN26965.1 hypothetical protein SAMN04487897_102340 [Paenibacillus sp. yr247]
MQTIEHTDLEALFSMLVISIVKVNIALPRWKEQTIDLEENKENSDSDFKLVYDEHMYVKTPFRQTLSRVRRKGVLGKEQLPRSRASKSLQELSNCR